MTAKWDKWDQIGYKTELSAIARKHLMEFCQYYEFKCSKIIYSNQESWNRKKQRDLGAENEGFFHVQGTMFY